MRGPLSTDLSVMMTCDRSTNPSTATYAMLTAAGLKDCWLQAGPGRPGPACCQDNTWQNALLNPTSTSRIDCIFSPGGVLKAVGDQIAGGDPGSRLAPAGFWPSDHAGLIVELA